MTGRQIWRLRDIKDGVHARPGRRGAWSEGSLCKSCGASSDRRIEPLIIEWDYGGVVPLVASAAWGSSDFVITDRVLQLLLRSRVEGFRAGRVKTKGRMKGCEDRKKVVWSDGVEELHELIVTRTVAADPERSTFSVTRACASCRKESYAYQGGEVTPSAGDSGKGQARGGLFVPKAEVPEISFFVVRQFPAWVLGTDQLRRLLMEKQLPFDFVPMGQTY